MRGLALGARPLLSAGRWWLAGRERPGPWGLAPVVGVRRRAAWLISSRSASRYTVAVTARFVKDGVARSVSGVVWAGRTPTGVVCRLDAGR